ncbi:MAG: hypothetical protein J6A88_08930 [Oscillospiraceae bacterium]|nr:hypothetical protein [Oscillospiraceae bacterium]
MKNDILFSNWVLNTVKEKYVDDIALVISHSTLNIDSEENTVSYFVPITDRGRQFAQTFIMDGRGYDIWGIEWERLERFANLDEYNITVLADSRILYSRTPEDAARFESLRHMQLNNLNNPIQARKHALESYATAKNLYTELLFAEGSNIRLYAGYILDYLARAIAFANHSYFHKSQIDQLEELQTMASVPSQFAEMYLEVIRTSNDRHRKELCRELISMVGCFLSQANNRKFERNFQDLADWYAELSYTWLRIRYYGQGNDAIKVHMWGIVLQNELNAVCEDFHLPKMELLSEYDYKDLSRIVARANKLEEQMRNIITNNGGIIRQYQSPEEIPNEV